MPGSDSRWLVTGARGMLGQDLAAALADRDAVLLGSGELDIRDPDAVRDAIADADVIVNAAAYTRVDDAEGHEVEALAVNGVGAGNLARAAATTGARLVQVSTDYVFDGRATEPYPESTPLDPLGAYGRTKADGEREVRRALPDAAWIVRTAWLYGAGGANFARTMLRLAEDGGTLSVVDDQIGQPTWSADVAAQILALVDGDAPPGIYHATSGGQTSWWGFARAVFEEVGLDPDRIETTTSDRFPRPAPRPAWSVLGHAAWDRVGIPPIGDWRDRLRAARRRGVLGG